jgi:hypothetical protein
MSTKRKRTWVCYGAGTDSTAMLIGMVARGEPIDLITFADTGAELPRTYEYIPIMDAWLRERGYPGITIVRYATRKGKEETLEESIVKNSTIPPLAFGWHTCSIRFKIDPQVKFAAEFSPFKAAHSRGERVVRCIGYDASPADTKRACRSTTKFPDLDQYENRFPLREWNWHRERCLEEILKAGLPDPGKSACYFCPARKKTEILELRDEYPEYYAKALAIEERALSSGKLKSVKGLGRRFAWKDVS